MNRVVVRGWARCHLSISCGWKLFSWGRNTPKLEMTISKTTRTSANLEEAKNVMDFENKYFFRDI